MSKIIIHEGSSFDKDWVARHSKKDFMEYGESRFFQYLTPEARAEALEETFRKSGGTEGKKEAKEAAPAKGGSKKP